MKHIAVYVVLALLGSCCMWRVQLPAPGPIPTALRGVGVVELVGSGQGSAVHVRDGIYLSARHVLAESALVGAIDRRFTGFETLAHGAGPAHTEDWLVFRPLRRLPELPGIAVDFTMALPAGEVVYAIGFSGSTESGLPTKRILRGVVNTPSSPTVAQRLYIAFASRVPQHGMSGGAVLAIRDGQPVLVGLVQGHVEATCGWRRPAILLLAIRPCAALSRL